MHWNLIGSDDENILLIYITDQMPTNVHWLRYMYISQQDGGVSEIYPAQI